MAAAGRTPSQLARPARAGPAAGARLPPRHRTAARATGGSPPGYASPPDFRGEEGEHGRAGNGNGAGAGHALDPHEALRATRPDIWTAQRALLADIRALKSAVDDARRAVSAAPAGGAPEAAPPPAPLSSWGDAAANDAVTVADPVVEPVVGFDDRTRAAPASHEWGFAPPEAPPPPPPPPPPVAEPVPAPPATWRADDRVGANVQPAGTFFRLWAPNAEAVTLVVSPRPGPDVAARLEASTNPDEFPEPTWRVPMIREPDDGSAAPDTDGPPPHPGCWCARVSDVGHLSTYVFEVTERHTGNTLLRRDPWARQTFRGNNMCVVHDPEAYAWTHPSPRTTAVAPRGGGAPPAVLPRVSTAPPSPVDVAASAGLRARGVTSMPWFGDAATPEGTDRHSNLIYYQMHIGSFTGRGDDRDVPRNEGTGDLVSSLRNAMEELPHIASLGFNAVQLLPTSEFTGLWGYNPVMMFAPHSPYGTPKDLRDFVDAAHGLGMKVFFDVVLHHGAAKDNSLWDFDGTPDNDDQNGGLYFEHGGSTPWGCSFAFWKYEVVHFLASVGPALVREFHIDGLRFDSIHNVPRDVVHTMVGRLRQEAPQCFLIAEHNPEDPGVALRDLGFDSMWCLSAFRDAESLMHNPFTGSFERKVNSLVNVRKGYEASSEYIKYLLGSHDEVGCRNNGGFHNDTQRNHRHAVDQYGGRDSWHARAKVRQLYGCMTAGMGSPMIFMGAELLQYGFWHTDDAHRFDWGIAGDDAALGMSVCMQHGNFVRRMTPSLQRGDMEVIFSHAHKQVMVYSRRCWVPHLQENGAGPLLDASRDAEGAGEAHYIPRDAWFDAFDASSQASDGYEDVSIVVVNFGDHEWGDHLYGIPVHGRDCERTWVEVFNSQREEYGGWRGSGNATDDDDENAPPGPKILQVQDGKIHVRVAKCSVHVFRAAGPAS